MSDWTLSSCLLTPISSFTPPPRLPRRYSSWLLIFSVIKLQALALWWILSYFDDEDSTSLQGWLSAAAIVLSCALFGWGNQLVCPMEYQKSLSALAMLTLFPCFVLCLSYEKRANEFFRPHCRFSRSSCKAFIRSPSPCRSERL